MKDHVICIISDWGKINWKMNGPYPIKGEIYTVERCHIRNGMNVYTLKEFTWCWKEDGSRVAFWIGAFRPVDSEFGPAICERVEDQINYEIAITA